MGRDSSVRIATRYGLDGQGVHPASCTIGTESFPVIKRAGRGTDPHLSAEVMKGQGYTSTHPLDLSALL